MRIIYIHIILLLSLSAIQCQEQERSSTPTMTSTVSSATANTVNNTTMTDKSPLMPTISSFGSNNITATSNRNSSTTMYFSPSPTSFVYTHFPIFPFHAIGSSSSIMSSARPSQSAPFPDDTIGKYGPLHISEGYSVPTRNSIWILTCCLMNFFVFF